MTINGTNLEGAKAVDFGLGAATIKTNSATEVVVLSPPGSGKVQVTVETAAGTSATSPADEYTYEAPPPPPPPAPTVTSIAPSKGPEVGGSEVTITGTNLEGAKAVDFGLGEATIKTNSATEVVVLSPPGSGKVQVTVETAGGTSATSPADEYTYEAPPPPPPPAPTVTSIAPSKGPEVGGSEVTITGTNLEGAKAVDFGLGEATIKTNSATEVVVLSPPGSGKVQVTVETAGGTSATSPADEYTYEAPPPPPPPAPTVTSIAPSKGPEVGGSEVTITGTNLEGAKAVDFGLGEATIKTDSATEVVVLSPAGSGKVQVTVKPPGARAPRAPPTNTPTKHRRLHHRRPRRSRASPRAKALKSAAAK